LMDRRWCDNEANFQLKVSLCSCRHFSRSKTNFHSIPRVCV
jgi:hypothetical protein